MKKRASFFDPCCRYWFKFNGKIYRFLQWSNYEQCCYGGSSRDYEYRLPLNDPRPRGVHMWGLRDEVKAFLIKLPENQWIIWG